MNRLLSPRASRHALVLGLGATGLLVACSSQPSPSSTGATTASALTTTRHVLGDINGDGLGDVALTGGKIPGTSPAAPWNTIPVAFSAGNGTFTVTNQVVPNFPTYATQMGASAVAGDFDGDGRADLALTGGWIPSNLQPWNTIPVAFSNGDGTFRVTNDDVTLFPTAATQTALRPVAGDFNGDGRADIAISGGLGWNTQPVAFSNGDGTFTVTNDAIANFAVYATQASATDRPVQLVAADFNGDGKTDLALTGGWIPNANQPWNTIPVAFSNGDGTFRVTNTAVAGFPIYATQHGALAVAGDFNGDGLGDIALTGGTGWNTVPVAFSNGDGSFRVTNLDVASFPIYATQGAQVVAADFDGDGKSDLALTGGGIPGECAPWNTLPVAFSNGDGTFRVTNDPISVFGTYAVQSGPIAVSGSQARPEIRFPICTLISDPPCPSCCPYN